MPTSSQALVSQHHSVRVVKVGGSLLGRPELPNSLHAWLAQPPVLPAGGGASLATQAPFPGFESISGQTSAHTVLIAGGGELVEVIRAADRTHHLGETAAHWLAVAAMRVSAKLLAKLVPQAALVDSWNELRERATMPGVTIFDVEPFMRKVEPNLPGRKLAESWDVTSDSIAARLAIALAASELVLLKSASPIHPAATLSELAAEGYVDRFLPSLQDELPVVRCEALLLRTL